ncbi:MAG: type II secretion system protein [bacterium]|nr:type II secretion system protein [bacterium]
MDNPQPTTNNLQRHHRRGFTLVETLVAASIFIMLTTIAVGVFVQALKSQRYLTALMAVN